MLKNLKLGTKMLGSFMIVAVIVLAVGIVGWFGIVRTAAAADEVGKVRLPSVETLLVIHGAQITIDSSENALLSRDISLEDRLSKYNDIEKAWSEIDQAWAIYEPLPQSIEEAALWEKFVPAWNLWKEDHLRFLELSRQYDSIVEDYYAKGDNGGISYAGKISGVTALINSAQTDFGTQVQEWKNILIRGNDAASYDKYLASFGSAEKRIRDTLNLVRSEWQRLGLDPEVVDNLLVEHENLGKNYRAALSVYDQDDPMSYSRVDSAVRGMDRPVSQAMDRLVSEMDAANKKLDGILAEMNSQALVVNMKSFHEAAVILDQIVAINREIAAAEVASASEQGAVLKLVIIISIAAGLLLSVALGIVLTRAVTKPLAEGVKFAEEIAGGNLTADLRVYQKDEIGILADSLRSMKDNLTGIISNVIAGAGQIASASEQLASGNQDLSNRTEQQASALEETSSAIEEMNASIKSNADNTANADALAKDAVRKTEEGAGTIGEMVESMDEINLSSNKIADIIEVITNIAFQTNLLALNASIEAARAGELGKGFAVVAVEVRKLAKRSDRAAKEITDIIKSSNQKVAEGVDIANRAGEVLQEINAAVKKVTTLVGEISAASQEQLSSADQIDRTLASLDENTQKNAALVEEAASATEELSAQAQELNSSMQFFRIEAGGTVTAVAAKHDDIDGDFEELEEISETA